MSEANCPDCLMLAETVRTEIMRADMLETEVERLAEYGDEQRSRADFAHNEAARAIRLADQARGVSKLAKGQAEIWQKQAEVFEGVADRQFERANGLEHRLDICMQERARLVDNCNELHDRLEAIAAEADEKANSPESQRADEAATEAWHLSLAMKKARDLFYRAGLHRRTEANDKNEALGELCELLERGTIWPDPPESQATEAWLWEGGDE